MAISDKNIRITKNTNTAVGIFPKIVFTGSSAGSSVVTLEVLDDNTVSFTSNEGQIFSLDSNLSTGTIWSVNDISGYPLLRADVGAASGATIRIAEGLGNVGIGETNPVYKFSLKGALGIGSTTTTNYTVFRFPSAGLGQSYVLPADYPSGVGTSFLSASTTGVMAWVAPPAGGAAGAGSGTVAIPGAQYQVAAYYHSATGASVSGSTTFTNNTATGVINITHATESTTSTTGALTVAGGAGIAKSLFVGTTLSVGQAPGYAVPNNLASFVSTVNSYNQLVIQNRSSGNTASANLVVNNDISTDAANYGELGINSSAFSGTGALNAPNAVYVAAASGPLVFGTTTSNPIRFVVNNGATDVMYIAESGTAVSVFTNLDLRSQNDIRFFNSGNTFNTALQAGANTVNYTLSLPTAPVGFGYSVLLVGNDGQMYFAPVTGGLASSSWGTNTPNLRMKMNHHIWFSAGYTPLAAGADNVTFVIPDASVDGTADLTFFLKEFQIRVETPSAGPSRIQIEKSSTNTGAFTLAATGSSLIAGSGLTISGAGIYVTSTTTFPAGIFITSNDLLRLNWTQLNATHANFSVTLTIEEV
jgi:hypothetical protein